MRQTVLSFDRVAAGIRRQEQFIHRQVTVGKVSEAVLERTRPVLDMDDHEYDLFRRLLSEAVEKKKLSPEEMATACGYSGGSCTYFNRQSLPAKAYLTQLFRTLLGDRKHSIRQEWSNP
jgi:hypothetical protein